MLTQVDSQDSNLQICYMYINQNASAYTCVPLFFIGAVLLGWTIHQYRVTEKLQKLHNFVRLIYITIYISIACYLIKIVLAQIIYWVQLYQNQNSHSYEQFSVASQYLFFVDFTGIFAMQTSILLIPTNWVNNIYQIFEDRWQKPQTSTEQKKQLKRSIIFERVCSKIMKYFLIARLVIFVIIILPYVSLVNFNYALSILIKIMLIWFSLESIFVFVILILGVISLTVNKKLNQLVYEEDISEMKKQYYLLILCTLIRLVTDLTYTILNNNQITNPNKCLINPNSPTNAWQIVNIILQGLLTQYFSIMIILKILYLKQGQKSADLLTDNESSRNQTKNLMLVEQ